VGGLGHPCTEAAVEHVLACAARRVAAHDDERAVVVHGDVHQLNALQVPGRDTFKLVDLDGLLAEAGWSGFRAGCGAPGSDLQPLGQHMLKVADRLATR